ncbi:hypothetical protein [Plasticicumulans lactativorans]|nr:hypothetical protein [Plasticicumulans lactativorans]
MLSPHRRLNARRKAAAETRAKAGEPFMLAREANDLRLCIEEMLSRRW